MTEPETVRTRTSSTVPFGWELHPENDSLLIENEAEQETLDYVREIAEASSLRTLVTVIQARTGRIVTPRGVQKILSRAY
tara:strand:- start:12014 stop:12253 length:240 start_codon:yes stop_codon:yes gene_type:complete